MIEGVLAWLQKLIFYLTEAIAWRRPDRRVLDHIAQRVDIGAISPQYGDLWRLYRAVRRHKPRVIWEFGAGWSTAILAQAVADNGFGRLYSMDADKQWALHVRRLLPPWLHADIRFAPVTLADVRGEAAWRHANRPEEAMPDLIYLDGPSGMRQCTGCADIPDIEERLQPGCVVIIDGRTKTTAMLRRTLQRRWQYWEERGPFGTKPIQRLFKLVG